MRTVTVGGFDLAFELAGEGPATVLVHRMAATAGAWGTLAGLLGPALARGRR